MNLTIKRVSYGSAFYFKSPYVRYSVKYLSSDRKIKEYIKSSKEFYIPEIELKDYIPNCKNEIKTEEVDNFLIKEISNLIKKFNKNDDIICCIRLGPTSFYDKIANQGAVTAIIGMYSIKDMP